MEKVNKLAISKEMTKNETSFAFFSVRSREQGSTNLAGGDPEQHQVSQRADCPASVCTNRVGSLIMELHMELGLQLQGEGEPTG